MGSGLYRCTCGLPRRGWSGNRYRCANGGNSRSGKQIDPFVETVVAERLARPDLADLLANPGGPGRANELLVEVCKLRERLAVTEGDYDPGLIDGRRCATAAERVHTEVQAVETERAMLLAGTGPRQYSPLPTRLLPWAPPHS